MTFSQELDAILDELDHKQYEHVMVLCTARRHGQGPQRLPDRTDHGRRIAALQVETEHHARTVLSRIDRLGRTVYVDVERKQDLNLIEIAQATMQHSTIRGIKPNDITVDALNAAVTHHEGENLTDAPIGIVGTGNLAFKFALLLAERGARVSIHGRSWEKAQVLCDAINAVLPRYSPHPVVSEIGRGLRVLISATTATHGVDPSWVDRLDARATCVDVGINNFSPTFISRAHDEGHTCIRLDFRSAGDLLPVEHNRFFAEIAGRATIAGKHVVAGGYIGQVGDVVVDQIVGPSEVIGIANGTGGLLARSDWSAAQLEAAEAIGSHIRTGAR